MMQRLYFFMGSRSRCSESHTILSTFSSICFPKLCHRPTFSKFCDKTWINPKRKFPMTTRYDDYTASARIINDDDDDDDDDNNTAFQCCSATRQPAGP